MRISSICSEDYDTVVDTLCAYDPRWHCSDHQKKWLMIAISVAIVIGTVIAVAVLPSPKQSVIDHYLQTGCSHPSLNRFDRKMLSILIPGMLLAAGCGAIGIDFFSREE